MRGPEARGFTRLSAQLAEHPPRGKGVAAGTYALVLTVDPDDLLHEVDETNNVAWRRVTVPPA